MISEKIYQSVFDELNKYLISDWSKLIVYIEYGEESYSIEFYEKNDSEYIKCYDLPGVSEKDMAKSFSTIDKLFSIERNKFSGDLWTNMTMVVSREGKMHIDFDYSDLSSGTYMFKKKWKEKYLDS